MSTRGFWPMRDLPVVGWLAACFVVTLVHPFIPAPRWLMIHLLLLGAAGHAILVWSRYFADTLLRLPATPRRPQNVRLATFNLGVLTVAAGVVTGFWPATVVGATAIATAVLSHGLRIARQLRSALASRFAPTMAYYVAAAALLPLGAALGTWLARGVAGDLDVRVRLAHVAVNLLGWIGLTVLGTTVTLWPTMLRTRIADGAERAARHALPFLVSGVLVAAGSALAGSRWGLVTGLAAYAVGVGILLVPAWRAMTTRRPVAFAAWSVLAGVTWLAGGLVALAVAAASADTWAELGDRVDALAPLLAVGFVAQVLLGASSYLLPVVRGGGPAAVRAANRVFDTAGWWRLVVTNVGLLVCGLPVPSLVRVVVSVLVLVALAWFLPLVVLALRAARRAQPAAVPATVAADGAAPAEGAAPAAREQRGPLPADGERPPGHRSGLALAGVATVVLAVAVGAALDPAALSGRAGSAAAGVVATGETTYVDVVAKAMAFHPSRISVPSGNRLVIRLSNESEGDVHDLVLDTGADTGRLAPGESATLDAGVIGRGVDGWCSVVGHRQMGMVLTVVVGEEAASETEHAHHSEPTGPAEGARDATLPPLTTPTDRPTVHRLTLEVRDEELEVAPGQRQTLWTYNGTAPGPVLHARVGDRFVIRLVNRGTMGHSIDFHAGTLAPDRPMRTIAPGASLSYRFTASRAGIWMYHCSSMPMTAHIANGLFGAVVVEPRDLPAVDRSYVLVQSELYLGADEGTVDLEKLADERPDHVVFNGFAAQYDAEPLPARVGERVRVWVLDAGPNRPSSFHVVGGQFDRVWAEGSYLLGSARTPAVDTGAQALALQPAQGGFVELEFPEAGHYPFVSHVMIDAERGAHGIFHVTP